MVNVETLRRHVLTCRLRRFSRLGKLGLDVGSEDFGCKMFQQNTLMEDCNSMNAVERFPTPKRDEPEPVGVFWIGSPCRGIENFRNM
jgi:hypothetical protein